MFAISVLCLGYPIVDVRSFPTRSRILFQGDSITDMNRGRNDDPNHILGHSYAFIIAASVSAHHPELNLKFFNRGVSGNRVTDLLDRWQIDAVDLHPTILSILVGVNDVDSDTSLDDFESNYEQLISRTRTALPDTRIVICEPFGLPTGWRKTKWRTLEPRLKLVQRATARVAKKFGAIFVPLQRAFDAAANRATAEYWIWDGVHPTYSGQQIIADEWSEAVEAYFRSHK